MESQDATAAPAAEVITDVPRASSRPILGFPLGTALLVVVIFSLSGMFSCCYHWNKVQALRRRVRPRRHPRRHSEGGNHHDQHDIPSSRSKPNHSPQHPKEDKGESQPVIMPGNRIPTFMAWPCPCESLPPPLSSPPVKFVVVDVVHMPPPSLLPPSSSPPPPPPPPPTGTASNVV